MKRIILLISLLLLPACTLKNSEDVKNKYVLNKEDVLCKIIDVKKEPAYKSSDVFVKTTYKCVFLKIDNERIDAENIEKRIALQKLI